MAVTTIDEMVRSTLAGVPLLADLEVVDVEVGSGLVRVTLDRPGGVDLDTLAQVNRLVAPGLDELDPVPGRYTLEVSSPGLERALRTPEHFARFVGATLSVKTKPGVAGERRFRARLSAADDRGVTLIPSDHEARHLAYDQIQAAHTVFEWGPAPAGPAGWRSSHQPEVCDQQGDQA